MSLLSVRLALDCWLLALWDFAISYLGPAIRFMILLPGGGSLFEITPLVVW